MGRIDNLITLVKLSILQSLLHLIIKKRSLKNEWEFIKRETPGTLIIGIKSVVERVTTISQSFTTAAMLYPTHTHAHTHGTQSVR